MHGWRLYKRRELDKLPPDDADAVRGFLTEQHAFQQQLLAWLRDDPATASFASDQLVARNSQLIWTWDYLSLAICLDWAPCSVGEVPTAAAEAELRLSVIEPDGRPPGASARLLTLDPWPFSVSSVEFHCDGRLLDRAFESEEELRLGLAQAPWETVSFELRSARHPQ